MDRTSIIKSFALFLGAVASPEPSFAETQHADWHAPSTVTERELDKILRQVETDDNVLDNLLGGRGKTTYHQTVDYTTILTRSLLAAIVRAEKAEVQRTCGGRYIDGELCGLDFVPLNCAQDFNGTYLYRTEAAGDHAVRIAYTWPGDLASPLATYRLIKQAAGWKIDGIRCRVGGSFNMSTSTR